MPIEIKELVIKVTVQESGGAATPSGGGGGGGGQQKQAIIEECVEKVMELLHEKNKDR